MVHQELSQPQREFLSAVSHQLRTPLTSIRSFSEILLRYPLEDADRQRHFLTIIHAEAERLSRTLEEFLDRPDGAIAVERRPLETEAST